MKKTVLYAFAASVMVLAGCNDMLDKSPRSNFSETPDFWNNSNLVETYCNKFYEDYAGYGYGGSGGWFYFKSLSDDQADPNFENWTFTTIPNKSAYWSDAFTEIRRANYVINGVAGSTMATAVKNNFEAVARLHRAWQYFRLVREYGDVQWQNKVILDPDDEIVQGERTDRDIVMESVLADLDFAIANITAQQAANAWSKDMAMAMKSDVCLFEGTYCKYRTKEENGKEPDVARAQRYLNECVKASEALRTSKRYILNAEYGTIYNSLDLSKDKEVIFWRNYEKDVQGHSTVDYTTSSTAQKGITKDAVDAFLFLDGKPLATTALDTNDKAVLYADSLYSIAHLLANKDKRLSAIIDPIVCFKGHGWKRASKLAEMTSSTGYTIAKYDTDALGDDTHYRNEIGTGYTDAPLYWLAVICLNEAEAKAELGNISQADLDATINKLQNRAGLPNMTLAPDADPANNMNVSNLLWEIRRCRRCELMTDNWYRYWDLVRWHQLDKLDSNRYPNIMLGANLSGVTNCQVELNNGYVIATNSNREFKPKYYFFPVPSSQTTLNEKTTQNPGW